MPGWPTLANARFGIRHLYELIGCTGVATNQSNRSGRMYSRDDGPQVPEGIHDGLALLVEQGMQRRRCSD